MTTKSKKLKKLAAGSILSLMFLGFIELSIGLFSKTGKGIIELGFGFVKNTQSSLKTNSNKILVHEVKIESYERRLESIQRSVESNGDKMNIVLDHIINSKRR